MASLTESVYRQAARLPLRDAAFHLWRYKSNFDSEELPPRPPVELNDAEAVKRFNESFDERYRHERDHAHEGITFDRMKRLHPRARDGDIRDAIKAAVKLDDDCSRYFDRDFTDLSTAVDAAMSKARGDNPGFLDDTYRSAENYLLYLWK
jgi:hypothetical protein